VGWVAAVIFCVGGFVGTGGFFPLFLKCGCAGVALVLGRPLLRCWFVAHTARAAAISDAPGVGDRVALYDCAVDIRGVHEGSVHIEYGGVVREHAGLPHAAGEANAKVAAAVIDTAVVADLGSPVAAIE